MRLISSSTGATAHVVVTETDRPVFPGSGRYVVSAVWCSGTIKVELVVEHQHVALKLARRLAHASSMAAIAEALALAMPIGSAVPSDGGISRSVGSDPVQTRGFGQTVGTRPIGLGPTQGDGSTRNSCVATLSTAAAR